MVPLGNVVRPPSNVRVVDDRGRGRGGRVVLVVVGPLDDELHDGGAHVEAGHGVGLHFLLLHVDHVEHLGDGFELLGDFQVHGEDFAFGAHEVDGGRHGWEEEENFLFCSLLKSWIKMCPGYVGAMVVNELRIREWL